MQQALSGYGANVITVPTDLEKGMDVNAVEFHLADGRHPAFLYAIPYAHNPLGVSITTSRAAKVVELAHTYGVPIVEDDPYGFLSYDDEASLPLRALDDQWVIYVGSFSKILAPALRLGWMVVPKGLIQKLTVLKEALDLETSALIQRSVSAYLDAGHLPGHLARLRKEYRIRRDTMLASMERLFPSAAHWTTPSGGMFIWVELPVHINTTELLRIAVEDEQVAFIPGSAFSASSGSSISGNNEQPDNCLRLNFSNSKPDDIEQGMAGLGRILHRFC
jgi:2-aminoadipate transaminase